MPDPVIYKYNISAHGETIVEMPIGASILDVQRQGNGLALWAIVNPVRDTKPRTFHAFMTGESSSAFTGWAIQYIATVQIGSFVTHVFEKL